MASGAVVTAGTNCEFFANQVETRTTHCNNLQRLYRTAWVNQALGDAKVIDDFAVWADQRGDSTVTRLNQTGTFEHGNLDEIEWVRAKRGNSC